MGDSTWSDVTLNSEDDQEKVEYEIEGKDEKPSEETQPAKEVMVEEDSEIPSWLDSPEEVKQEEPKELEGVETKGAQKRIRQLVNQRKERDNQIQTLIQQNEQLNNKLFSREKEFTEAQVVSTETSERQLKDGYDLAKSNYLEAYQSGEAEKVLHAQEALNKSQLDIQNLAQSKAALDKYRKVVENEEQQRANAPKERQSADPRAIAWASDNEWFGKDTVMTAAALAIDGELKNVGLNPNDDEYYEQVDKRLRKEFPHKFGQEVVLEQEIRQQPTTQAAQVVSGASRSPATSGKKVKLTQDDMRLAQKWDIPLEMYAAEKLKVTQADGDYTETLTKRGGY
jgi:hypothetical protein